MKPRLEVHFTPEQRNAFLRRKPSYIPERNEFLLNHARSGLLLALHALNLPSHSKVGMMVYNCHTVMNAIVQADMKPIFIDVDDKLRINFDDLRKKSDEMRVLVVTHLFGIVNDIESIHKLYPDLIIIEDCAHAFGKEVQGDFGVYSIGQGKLPSLGDGGILVVNNNQYVEAVKTIYNQLPTYTSWDNIMLFCKLLITSILYSKLLFSCITLRLKHYHKNISGHDVISVKRMSQGVQSMYAVTKENVSKSIVYRRQNADREIAKLQNEPHVTNILCGINAFMLVVHCTDPRLIQVHYKKNGIDTATHFADCIHWAERFGYHNDCLNAEKLVNNFLMIPTY